MIELPPVPMPPPGYEETTAAVIACGVPAGNIRIGYEDELQSDVVHISDLGGSDEARLHCLRRAIHPFYVVLMENAEQRGAYFSFASREDSRAIRAEAIAWLEANGMINRVPQYDPAQGLAAFSRALEAACELPPGGVLEVVDSATLIFRPDYLERRLTNAATGGADDGMTCLGRFFAASNAEEHGIGLGFLGYAAVQDQRD